jgi:hypothetical protein
MWFDARARLVEIAGQPPAASAIQAPALNPKAVLSYAPPSMSIPPSVAEVAIVATPPARTAAPKPSAETFPHGLSVTGQPKTWTGRIVSLDDWHGLTDWEKHGSNGRPWCGVNRNWKWP